MGNDRITRILSGRIYCEKERDGNSGGSERKIGGGKRRKGTTTKKKKNRKKEKHAAFYTPVFLNLPMEKQSV